MIKQVVNQEIIADDSSGNKWGRVGILIITFAIAIFMGVFGYGYYELSKINIALAQTVSTVEQQATETEQNVNTLRQSVDDMKGGLTNAKALSEKQEQLVAEWQSAQKGDLVKWRLAEAQYLLKIANDHLKLMHDTGMAVTLLQRADETLAPVQNERAVEIRKAIQAALTALSAAPQVDVSSLYLNLNALNGQLEQLPLPAETPKPLSLVNTTVDIPAGTPWWKAGLLHSWQTLHKFVIVRNMGVNGAPLVFPEEKTFLYQNLHAQMQNTMWAVLYRQNDVYQASLANAALWIQRYFIQEAPETKTILQTIEQLQQIDIKPAIANVDNILQLFNGGAAPVVSESSAPVEAPRQEAN